MGFFCAILLFLALKYSKYTVYMTEASSHSMGGGTSHLPHPVAVSVAIWLHLPSQAEDTTNSGSGYLNDDD